MNELFPYDGFLSYDWALPEKPFAECPYPAACVNNSCVKGNVGVLCAVCDVGYVRGPQMCEQCTPEGVGAKIGITVGLFVVVLVFGALWQTKLKKCRKKCK